MDSFTPKKTKAHHYTKRSFKGIKLSVNVAETCIQQVKNSTEVKMGCHIVKHNQERLHLLDLAIDTVGEESTSSA